MSKFEKLNLQRETFVDKIVEITENRISSGEIKAGAMLSETALAKDFNVSRGPAREALLRLEEMGLVLKTHIGREVKGFNVDEFRQNFELKMIVESFCSMQGAFNATERDISIIQGFLDKSKTYLSPNNEKKRLLTNSKFHESLVNCSQNDLLVEIYKTQVKKVAWARFFASNFFASLKYPRAKEGYKEHLEIFDAFVKKDGERVRKLSENHQKKVMKLMLERFDKR